MKNVIFILATAFLGFTALSFDLYQPSFTTNEEDIEIVFNSSMDKAKLEEIQKDLSQKGIVLSYETLKFTKKGKLKHISFSVDCTKLGFKGTASNSLLGFSKKFGFAIRYAKTGNGSFHIGRI